MRLPRSVWMLGWVSFFTDTASEMVYPLLPLFLTRVLGAGAMSLGVIEGLAEAANSILKIVSGRLADRTGAPKRLVLAGYGLSSMVRPFIALAFSWVHVLILRFTDRFGKGLRTSPRDAMLATFADSSNRGKVFGFHRAMDHAGAVIGPLLASAFLYVRPGDYRTLFALTVIPGIVVIIILLRVPDTRKSASAEVEGSRPPSAGRSAGHTRLPSEFHRAMTVILLFSLGNASDAFLLLRFADVGITAFWIPLLWSAIHVVKTASSLYGGQWSDRLGRRHVIGLGWLVYAGVYGAFAVTDSASMLVIVFLVYGLYFGLTEGVEKAWVADLAPADGRGNAFGIYNAVIGIGALAASLLFGFIWTHVSPPAAFYTGAGFAVAATALLYLMFSSESRPGRWVEGMSGRPAASWSPDPDTNDENHSGHQ
jgi:MFS family permease